MKKWLFSTLAVCMCSWGMNQNLVPNPGFEEHTGCPEDFPDLDGKCTDWLSFRGTPDYMNDCAPLVGSNNQFGYQEPHTGEAYAGIVTFHKTVSDAREHLAVQLIQPLTIDQEYYFSFFVSSGYTPLQINISTNKIGALLTTYEYSDPDLTLALLNTSTVYTEAVIKDTVNWVKISGSFIADSTYEYLILGSFFDDDHIDTSYFPYQVVPQVAYYYLDDVCLSTDSLYAHTWTTLSYDELERSDISVYPNPSTDFVRIQSTYPIHTLEIFSSTAQLIGSTEIGHLTELSWSSAHLENGMYYFKIHSEAGIETRPVSIQR